MNGMKRRVVVTGLGAVTPVGLNLTDSWDALLSGTSGIATLTAFDATDYSVRIAGEVKGFDPTESMPGPAARKVDRFTQLGMAAATEAMADAGLEVTDENATRCSVVLGSGIGGLIEIESQHKRLLKGGPGRVSPFLIPKLMLNALSGQVSMKFGLKGANFATASACASAGHALGMALRLIQYGDADVVVSGGSEAAITTLGMAGFASLKALSSRNDDPERASRPFDKDRDGFVMGEGAGILVLEELSHAQARGATIYCELAGVGMTGDAHHITQPAPEAEGAQRAMRLAMEGGEMDLSAVSYINAHGTSTPLNDMNESMAIRSVFGEHADKLVVNSTKSMIGHLLGGSAAVEAVVSAKSIYHGVVHQTLNHEEPGEGCDLDYVKGEAREIPIDAVLSNSLGFGGHNVSVALRRMAND